MRAVIIDDERLARQELKRLIEESADTIQVVGEANNGLEGIKTIKKLAPDIIFLDIQMPEMDGFEMLKHLEEIPIVIFTSAYDEYALEAFRANALDYLLKPIDPTEFINTIQKIEKDVENEFYSDVSNYREDRRLTANDKVLIKDGEKCYFPQLQEIFYFESHGNYVKIYFKENKPMILRSLNALEERLSPEDFFRANRKYLINIHAIKQIENWFNGGLKVTLENNKEVEISRRQAIRFKDIMAL